MIIGRPLPDGVGIPGQVFGANVADYIGAGFAGHEGLDYPVAEGNDTLACADGVVIFAGPGVRGNAAYGNFIIVSHGRFQSWYCHLSQIWVTAGQTVIQGQVIGKTGNSGTHTTGPHLHFAIRVPRAKNGSKGFVDPWALRVILGDA